MKISAAKILLLILTIPFSGCLKDAPTVPLDVKTNNDPVLLSYLETHGDYINSDNFPSIIDAQEVYGNINNYLIIDVRTRQDFVSGHIQNANNIKPDSLLLYMKAGNSNNYSKVIIVSATGQAASYYACLLILDGYSNVYAMRYGMAAWNSIFSASWSNAIGNIQPANLTKTDYGKAGYSPLPSPAFPDPEASAKSKLESRIEKLLSEGFEDDLSTEYSTPVTDIGMILPLNISTGYLICLGEISFYTSYWGVAHPFYAVHYLFGLPNREFESANYLQTLPSSKTIYLYSYAGHISAFFTAYLRILGYDARSILFGGNNFIYYVMQSTPGISQYTFTSSDINDFPFVTGN